MAGRAGCEPPMPKGSSGHPIGYVKNVDRDDVVSVISKARSLL